MKFHVLSLFPEMLDGIFDHSIPRIAQEKGSLEIQTHYLRDWSHDAKHHKVDDSPYGGGPGMVIKCDCVIDAVEAIEKQAAPTMRKILLSPAGRPLDQKFVRELATEEEILLIAGRYEGFDHRIFDALELEEVSIGDYVLSGGEIAAMVIIDAVTRLLPGVLGHVLSAEQESFENGLLDFPVYTRPEEFRGLKVPEVLLSGHAAKIETWQKEQATLRTQTMRKDLMNTSALDETGA